MPSLTTTAVEQHQDFPARFTVLTAWMAMARAGRRLRLRSRVDKRAAKFENRRVRAPGASRKQLARTLNAAYADGLISHDTFVQRLDRVLTTGLIDRRSLIGDLPLAVDGKSWRAAATALWRTIVDRPARPVAQGGAEVVVLALDWTGEITELFIGRHYSCDIVLANRLVSRRHARLFYRDGGWIIQDLESTNGTRVNGARVGRCKLHPGDEVCLATDRFQID